MVPLIEAEDKQFAADCGDAADAIWREGSWPVASLPGWLIDTENAWVHARQAQIGGF